MTNDDKSVSQANKTSSASTLLPIIGWREIIALPQLNVDSIKAKIDTGARSSAIHAFKIREFERDGKVMIAFQIHPFQKDNKQTIVAEAELLEYRKVKSSNGQTQNRPVIKTYAQLGSQQWEIELTLTNRDVMGFRMLLGRQALRSRFLINPGKSYLQSRRRK